MKGGLIPEDHPMATGINPATKKFIWTENLIYKTPRSDEFQNAESDEEIINAVGKHMREMVHVSSSSKENPNGIPDRMPPAINYIHACVHFNGGFLLFNDFKEAISHFTNKEFKNSFIKFVKEEKREPVTVFRNKNYDPKEYLDFVCFLRSQLPWFSNTNGNKKRIGWGNPAPYPATNTITGYWKDDLYKFYNIESRKTLCRPPISKKYFLNDNYIGSRNFTLPEEKCLSDFTNNRVLARGARGNMFFVDLRKLNKGFRFDPNQTLPNIFDRLLEKLTEKV